MKKIDFLATDGIKLNGILYEGEQITEKVILSIHGMSSNCFKKREDVIAKNAISNNIDYFCFNNRGSELVKYNKKVINGVKQTILGGTTFEDVLDGYADIVGAILKLKEIGYKNIYLQGHSLGCTKIVYTYNKLKDENKKDILLLINKIILLSLIDIPNTLSIYLGDKLNIYIKYAEKKEREGKEIELMPEEAFIHPISVKTFLRYARDNKEINFANYGQDKKLVKLNNIEIPLFMRWGNQNEMILQEPKKLVSLVSEAITNRNKDINYIDGANHSYTGKEEELAKQVVNFIRNSE